LTLKGLAGFPQAANDYRRGAQSRGGTVYACALRSRRYSHATEAFNVNENGYIPALEKALRDGDAMVRTEAERAIKSIRQRRV